VIWLREREREGEGEREGGRETETIFLNKQKQYDDSLLWITNSSL